MTYSYFCQANDQDVHSITLDDGKYIAVYFYPVKHWINQWKAEFFGRYCPILSIDTPWFELFADFRPVTSSVVRNLEN
jgi:effector-binding domain-containing protein